MFEIGEYIVYGVKGVCRIEDITHIDISGGIKTVCIMFLPRLAMAVEGSMHRRTIRRLRCAK